MGGPNEIQLYADSLEQAQEWAAAAIYDVKRIEGKYSRYREDSLLAEIHSTAGKTPIKVDEETTALLNYAQTCYNESDGRFDVTAGILRRIWDFKSAVVPSQSQIDEILPLIGWNRVKWTPPELFLPLPEMEIDFGGFGKEYAVDHAAGVLEQLGVLHGFVNLGGDIRILGPHPDGNAWNIGIAHPRLPGDVLTAVQLCSGSLATSGDYERYFEHNGVRYSHILDAKSGWPARGFQSVSIMAESCLVAGSFATIAMLLGKKRGKKLLRQLRRPHIVVLDGGSVINRSDD